MKTLNFIFSRPKTWKPLAEIIMSIDHDNFDHGAIRFTSDRWKSDFIYQSSGLRTNFMGGEYFDSINETVESYQLDVDDQIEADIGHLCVEREGRPYPTLTITGIGLVKLLSMVKLTIKNPWPSVDRDCVGEMVFILQIGLKVPCTLDPNEITPRQFRDWLLTLPNIKRVK